MKIAFVSEMGFYGKLPKDFKDFRTVESWVYGFNAFNIPFNMLDKTDLTNFDLFIVIIPKNNVSICKELLNVLPMNKTSVLQEGPCYYFQDSPAMDELKYAKLLNDCKFILCHNESDCSYFRQFNKNCTRIPTCTDTKIEIKKEDKKPLAFSFGTFSKWYNGQTSYRILKEIGYEVWMSMMGRWKRDEGIQTKSKGIQVLGYLCWADFIKAIKNVSVACHMMPTKAASSYVLVCALLDVPCICSPSDMSKDLFPYTTTNDAYDYEMGAIYAKKLVNDKEFYAKVVNHAKINLAKYDYRVVCPIMIKKFKRLLK